MKPARQLAAPSAHQLPEPKLDGIGLITSGVYGPSLPPTVQQSRPRTKRPTCIAESRLSQPSEQWAKAERALVRRAQKGDEEAFRLIVETNQRKVFSIIQAIIRNRNDWEDIGQQTVTKIYFALPSFNFRAALSTWISRITVNECYDYLRKQKCRKLTFESHMSEADLGRMNHMAAAGARRAAEAMERQLELRECVVQLLGTVSEEERALLIMKEVEGYQVEELARLFSLNPNTVKVKLFRARQKLLKSAKEWELLAGHAAAAG